MNEFTKNTVDMSDSNPRRYFSKKDMRLATSCFIILARTKMLLVDLGFMGLNHVLTSNIFEKGKDTDLVPAMTELER